MQGKADEHYDVQSEAMHRSKFRTVRVLPILHKINIRLELTRGVEGDLRIIAAFQIQHVCARRHEYWVIILVLYDLLRFYADELIKYILIRAGQG